MKKYSILMVLVLAFLAWGCNLDPPDIPHSVIYHGNGNTHGYPPTDSNEYSAGMEAVILGQGTLGKEGYTFQFWNTSSDGTGDSYNYGDTIEIKNTTIFLYAVWANL